VYTLKILFLTAEVIIAFRPSAAIKNKKEKEDPLDACPFAKETHMWV